VESTLSSPADCGYEQIIHVAVNRLTTQSSRPLARMRSPRLLTAALFAQIERPRRVMNRIQILHRAIAAGNIAVVFGGLSLGGPVGITLNVLLLLFVVILLRVKFWVDDEQYIDDVKSGKLPGGTPYHFGIGVAVLSWLLWYLGGFFIQGYPVVSGAHGDRDWPVNRVDCCCHGSSWCLF